jgi:hypothetical protein
MISPSACPPWQPDRAADPAQQRRSYTTWRDTIDLTLNMQLRGPTARANLSPSKQTELDMLAQVESSSVSAHTVDEFCRGHRISRGTFYNLLKIGEGPTIMKVGGRTLVSTEAAAAWRRKMEQPTTKQAA